MENFYLWFSNLILVIHFLFILFVLFGGLLVLRWPKSLWLHLPAICWGFLVELNGWLCPLTPWENHYRRLAGSEAYQGDFIGEYLIPLIYPIDISRELQYLFAVIVIILNLVIYYFVFCRLKKASNKKNDYTN